MKKILFLLIVLAIAAKAYPQNTWRSDRHGFVLGAGCNIFMGDLGGGYKNGTHIFAMDDVDPNFLNMSAMLGYRYRLSDRLAVRANFLFSKVSADDANSKDMARRSRNLNFRSSLIDIGATLDYYFLRENTGRFDPSSLKHRWSGYFFVGIGFLHYNPQGKYQNQWFDLQPLCTEGQGTGARFETTANGRAQVVEAGDKYSLTAAAIPIGVGFKFQVAKDIMVGLELAQRFSTTDYIDDCSTYYFNYQEQGVEPPSSNTVYFADRRLDAASSKTGTPRGNPGYNDSYFTAMFTIYYRLFKGNGGERQ